MNKLFGFFKEKIVQANVQNKKELQSLVSVLSGDDTSYKSQIILSHLQKIKSNYMTWSILIANEASTGLYYSQLHNHNVCLKKVTLQREFELTIQKYTIVNNQIKKTHQQLKQVANLSQNWVKNMSQKMQQIKSLRVNRLQQIMTQIPSQNQQSKYILNTQKALSQEIKNQNKSNNLNPISSPIILSQTLSQIIQLSQQQNDSPILKKIQKW